MTGIYLNVHHIWCDVTARMMFLSAISWFEGRTENRHLFHSLYYSECRYDSGNLLVGGRVLCYECVCVFVCVCARVCMCVWWIATTSYIVLMQVKWRWGLFLFECQDWEVMLSCVVSVLMHKGKCDSFRVHTALTYFLDMTKFIK